MIFSFCNNWKIGPVKSVIFLIGLPISILGVDFYIGLVLPFRVCLEKGI